MLKFKKKKIKTVIFSKGGLKIGIFLNFAGLARKYL